MLRLTSILASGYAIFETHNGAPRVEVLLLLLIGAVWYVAAEVQALRKKP